MLLSARKTAKATKPSTISSRIPISLSIAGLLDQPVYKETLAPSSRIDAEEMIEDATETQLRTSNYPIDGGRGLLALPILFGEGSQEG